MDKLFDMGSKILKLIWLLFLYQLSQTPFILAKVTREKNLMLYIVTIILGLILSIACLYYIWNTTGHSEKVEVHVFKKQSKRQKILIYLILLVGLISFALLSSVIKPTAMQQQTTRFIHNEPLALLISTVIMGPIIEELIFRLAIQRIFFQKIENYLQLISYVIVSTVTFAFVHTSNLNIQLLPYLLMGLIFSLAYVLLKNIKYDISLHMINNLLAFVSMTL